MGRTLRIAGLFLPFAFLMQAADKPRVFVTESSPLQLAGKADGASLSFSGGTSPQNVEVMKQMQQRCPGVIITADPEKADYTVRLDHEPPNPTTLFVHGNKVAVFDRSQDLIFSDSTRLLKTAVDKACAAMLRSSK
ncbi:MAG TPA: hypothetical protein VGF16_04825 [Bryobacteraceae bacterium]|jgi:hypothetical protein